MLTFTVFSVLSVLIANTAFSQCYVHRTDWRDNFFDEPIGRCFRGPWGYSSLYTCIDTGNRIYVRLFGDNSDGAPNCTDAHSWYYADDGERDLDSNDWVIKCTPGCNSTANPTTFPTTTPTTSEPTTPSTEPTIAPTAGIWTDLYGYIPRFGCSSSVEPLFEARNSSDYINKICARYGDESPNTLNGSRLWGIQVGFTDDTESDFAGWHLKGDENCYTLQEGDCFSSVNITWTEAADGYTWSDEYIVSLQFGTSNGDVTPLWGERYNGHGFDMISYGNDYCIYGMYACDKFDLTGLRFYFAPKESVAPSMTPTMAPSIITSTEALIALSTTMQISSESPTNQPTEQVDTISPSIIPTSNPTDAVVWLSSTMVISSESPTAQPTEQVNLDTTMTTESTSLSTSVELDSTTMDIVSTTENEMESTENSITSSMETVVTGDDVLDSTMTTDIISSSMRPVSDTTTVLESTLTTDGIINVSEQSGCNRLVIEGWKFGVILFWILIRLN